MKDDNFIKENNAKHLWHPMGHPADSLTNPPTVVVSAKNSSIIDMDGHVAIDAVGGLWCVNLGYSNTAVKDAIAKQVYELPYYSSFAGTTNGPAIEASLAVREMFEADGMSRVFFTSGGSDAVETSLRLARQYHRLRGEPGRTKFISLKKGYHGTHFGGASVNGNNRFRINYEPLLPGCFHLPSPYTYRNPFNETDPATLAQSIAATFEDEVAFQGAGSIAAFIMEPIQGAGGVIVPDASFMGLMRDVCDRHGILMISDEVITGFGRTGDWSGARHYKVKPDMMCMAKGITSAYFPVGAALMSDKVVDVFENDTTGDGAIFHGYTYSGHPLACAAGLATLDIYRDEKLFENAANLAPVLEKKLHTLRDEPNVIDIRNIGMIGAVELAPSDAGPSKRAYEVFLDCWRNNVMVRFTGDTIAMSPPLIMTEDNIEQLVETLRAAIRRAA